tara:strand:+ start:96 stop:647 length:552 start_codon:yes stop_codon:yes gene_type:complete
MIDQRERQLDSHLKYDGRLIRLFEDQVQLPSQVKATREVVDHDPAVVVIPVNGDLLCMVRQYRYAIRSSLLEFPAGMIAAGEAPLAAAKRELKEETGCEARQWQSLGMAYPSPGFCNEIFHFYLAQGLDFGAPSFDDDESCDLVMMRVDSALHLCATPQMTDLKSMYGVLWLHRYLLSKGGHS